MVQYFQVRMTPNGTVDTSWFEQQAEEGYDFDEIVRRRIDISSTRAESHQVGSAPKVGAIHYRKD
jgi:hypothetical protein